MDDRQTLLHTPTQSSTVTSACSELYPQILKPPRTEIPQPLIGQLAPILNERFLPSLLSIHGLPVVSIIPHSMTGHQRKEPGSVFLVPVSLAVKGKIPLKPPLLD